MNSSALLKVTQLVIPFPILHDKEIVVLHNDNVDCSCLSPPWTGI